MRIRSMRRSHPTILRLDPGLASLIWRAAVTVVSNHHDHYPVDVRRTSKSRTKSFARILKAFVRDPLVTWRAIPGEIRQMHGTPRYGAHDVDPAWDERLHSMLGVAWPCPEAESLTATLEDVSDRLALHGITPGRCTYGNYSDADTSLCKAIWCAIRHVRPKVVIETGVAHGVSSQVALEALATNKYGRLWSIDLRHPFHADLHSQTGIAVAERRRAGWGYVQGRSRQRLPHLIAEVGRVDLFIHDSLHTARNTLFEMDEAAAAMFSGGLMLIDDIFEHDGFKKFAARHPEYDTIICQPGDGFGAFGIALKVG